MLNDLFKINSLTENAGHVLAEVALDASHPIFEGHFPGSPVTPGVVQLHIVKQVLEQHLNRPLKLKTMRTCKFLQIINPIETPVLYINLKITQSEHLEVVASGSFKENIYFKAQIAYL
jgi:3-hydroxyacyl-[acyl-carrier-protein] dehydratase